MKLVPEPSRKREQHCRGCGNYLHLVTNPIPVYLTTWDYHVPRT